MPLVKTTISYEDEEFGDKEVIVYQKQVPDLDPYFWLFYLMAVSEHAGYDFVQLTAESPRGFLYKTDI